MGHSFFVPLMRRSEDWGAAPAKMNTGLCPRSTLCTAPAKPYSTGENTLVTDECRGCDITTCPEDAPIYRRGLRVLV